MTQVQAWAASKAGAALEPFRFTLGELPASQVEIAVDYCGLCHSDLSMLDNEWGMTRYPFVPGHEAVGRIIKIGTAAEGKGLKLGQRVGIGWLSSSCMHCDPCIGGDHNLCSNTEMTIVGQHGGLASHLRAHWAWAIPLPDDLDPALAGPLFCGGITVFNPLVQFDVKPSHRVGVVGIGGLGHLALRFLNAWGCEVTAFTSSPAKAQEAMDLGAHRVVSSTDAAAMKALTASLDFVLVTANAPLDWSALIATLSPRGRLHFVGAVIEPLSVQVFELMGKQRSLSASPIGSPATLREMLRFCARHQIVPKVESFPISQINAAFAHLRAGKARYRIVLDCRELTA